MFQNLRENPEYPYMKGGPVIIDVNVPHRFSVGQKVRPSEWIRNYHHLNPVVIVLMTRKIKETRRGEFSHQVVVTGQPHKWSGAGHFEPHEYEGVPVDQIVWPWIPEPKKVASPWVSF